MRKRSRVRDSRHVLIASCHSELNANCTNYVQCDVVVCYFRLLTEFRCLTVSSGTQLPYCGNNRTQFSKLTTCRKINHNGKHEKYVVCYEDGVRGNKFKYLVRNVKKSRGMWTEANHRIRCGYLN